MKIQYKIALLFTYLCTSIIIALSFAVFYFAYEEAFQDFFTRLELRAGIAAKANLDVENENKAAYEKIRREHLQVLPDEKEFIIRIDTLSRLLAHKLSLQVPPDFYKQIIAAKKATFRNDYRFYQGIYYQNKKSNYIIIVSAENTYAKQFLANLRTILITGCIISMVIVFSISLLFSRYILLPIRNITKQVQNINATSLHKRLLVKPGKDEISGLAYTFNDMISRLEMAFETQHNFVSNASHELNTPLTAIIGEADYALSGSPTLAQYQEAMTAVLAHAEKLRDITKGLLELARSGFVENFSMEKVRIDEIVYNVQKIARQVYPQSQVKVDYSLYPDDADKLTILANTHLIELAVSNIVLNACKYSGDKQVVIALAISKSYIVIIVKDNGIGIPTKDITHIFDPFFRASNVKGKQGYGIGLPLTMNIVKIHKGFITISSKENEGTEVIIKLPMYAR